MSETIQELLKVIILEQNKKRYERIRPKRLHPNICVQYKKLRENCDGFGHPRVEPLTAEQIREIINRSQTKEKRIL